MYIYIYTYIYVYICIWKRGISTRSALLDTSVGRPSLKIYEYI